MRTMMVFVVAMALALGGAACKKGGEAAGGAADLCNHKSKCEKEEAPTADKIKECQEGIADKDCGAVSKAAMECAFANESCTPEGKSDMSATMTKCEAQMNAMMECMMKKAAADAGAAAPPPAP
jgi:hypothetical protein